MAQTTFACITCGSTEVDGIVTGSSYLLRCTSCGEKVVTSYVAVARGDQKPVEIYLDPQASRDARKRLAVHLGRAAEEVDHTKPIFRGRHITLRAAITGAAAAGIPLLIRWVPEAEVTDLEEGWSIPCSECGRPGDYFFGDRASGARLQWFESFRCEHCGSATEADGYDQMAERLRMRLIARHGLWAVQVVTGSPVTVVKVVRELFGLPLSDVGALKRKLPGPIFPGTRGEAERLRNALVAADIECHTVMVDKGT